MEGWLKGMKGYKKIHAFIPDKIYNQLQYFDLFSEFDDFVTELLEKHLEGLMEGKEGEKETNLLLWRNK